MTGLALCCQRPGHIRCIHLGEVPWTCDGFCVARIQRGHAALDAPHMELPKHRYQDTWLARHLFSGLWFSVRDRVVTARQHDCADGWRQLDGPLVPDQVRVAF